MLAGRTSNFKEEKRTDRRGSFPDIGILERLADRTHDRGSAKIGLKDHLKPPLFGTIGGKFWIGIVIQTYKFSWRTP